MRFSIPENSAAIATIAHRGSSNFAVKSIAADGSSNGLLVNEIGNYAGTVLFDTSISEHSVAFDVEADGSWTILIQHPSKARRWDGRSALTARGDSVLFISPAVSGFLSVTASHRGSSNFAVRAYGDQRSLLVNEIGRFSGRVLVPSGTLLLEVTADGDWSVTPD